MVDRSHQESRCRSSLFYSPFHGFVHKSLVVAHECGLMDDIVRVPTFPFKNTAGELVRGQYSLAALNPLDKVPTLVTDQGQVVYGSQAICELLDAHSKAARMFPPVGPARWDALTRMATGDALFEFAVQMSMEMWLPREEWRLDTFQWLTPKVSQAFDKLETQVADWSDFDVGHSALLQGISYLDARTGAYEDGAFVERAFDWRRGHPALAAWYADALARPSVQFHFQKPYEGDSSAAFFADMVAEAQRRQGAAQ